jgi:hypothetical protein
MTPKIKKQKKLLINQGTDNHLNSFSRLEATATAEIPTTVSQTFQELLNIMNNFYEKI